MKVYIHIHSYYYKIETGRWKRKSLGDGSKPVVFKGMRSNVYLKNKCVSSFEQQNAVVQPYSHIQLRHQTRLRPEYSLGYRFDLLEFARGRPLPHIPILSCCSKQLWEFLAAFARRERTQYFVRLVWAVT